MNDLAAIHSLFKQVSQSDFNKWLDTRIPKLQMQTPREVINKGEGEKIINLLSSFLPKPKMP